MKLTNTKSTNTKSFKEMGQAFNKLGVAISNIANSDTKMGQYLKKHTKRQS